ncbi:DsbG Protein-disulfide isomerase [Rhabdaerophilaceae bacterium]
MSFFSPMISGFTRRSAMVASLVIGIGSVALAQQQSPTAPIKDVMQAGPLGDRILGKADAPVTIVEYASFTCIHCALFHTETLPKLKEKYIESGKVRLIFREFPFDPMATAISMITRCAPEPRYFPLADLYFRQLDSLRTSQKPLDDLLATARQAGFTQESFEACLKNQSVYDGVNAVKKHAADVLGVNSTPTFFINGQRVSGAKSIEEMDKILEPLLPK